MSMARMFLDQHAFLHSADITNGPSFVDRTFADLTDAQMRVRPGKGVNSLAWLLWHMARTEDVNVNLVIVDRRQVFDEAWARRLNVSRADIGTGMTEDEVGDLTESLDIAANAGVSQCCRPTYARGRRVTWRQRSRRNRRSRGCCPRECGGRDRCASRMVVGLHAEPVTCDATHDGRHHPQRAASRRGADSTDFRGIRWRPIGNLNASTPSCRDGESE